MGRIEREGSGFTRYIWYSGQCQRLETAPPLRWPRVRLCSLASTLWLTASCGATVVGTTVTACMTGYGLGNKDASGFDALGSLRSSEAGRALWRALAKGFGAAGAAILVVHAAPSAGLAGWGDPAAAAGDLRGCSPSGRVMQVRMSAARAAEAAELKKTPVAAGSSYLRFESLARDCLRGFVLGRCLDSGFHVWLGGGFSRVHGGLLRSVVPPSVQGMMWWASVHQWGLFAAGPGAAAVAGGEGFALCGGDEPFRPADV